MHKHECAALADEASPLRMLAAAPSSDLLLAGRCLWRRHGGTKGVPPTEEDRAFDAMEAALPSNE